MAAELKKPDTSSIGPTWPPRESSFRRIKGIDTRSVVRDEARLESVILGIRELAQEMDKGNMAQDRISVRVLVENNVLANSSELISEFGEAIVSLSGTRPELNSSSFLYLGHNSQSRQSDPEDLQKSLKNIQIALETPRASYSEIKSRVASQGVELAILNNDERIVDQEILGQMTELYSRFGWDKNGVADILANQNNIICVARDGQRIVSAGIAEQNTIRFSDGMEVRIAEITEAATHEEYKGRGLYSGVAAKLMHEIHDRSELGLIDGGRIDLVFGECNGTEIGVLKAAKSLGRTFTIETSRANGPVKGFLPQHVPIAGSPRNATYNDLFPAFITRAGISLFVHP